MGARPPHLFEGGADKCGGTQVGPGVNTTVGSSGGGGGGLDGNRCRLMIDWCGGLVDEVRPGLTRNRHRLRPEVAKIRT